VFRFFLKLRPCVSSSVTGSTFEALLPFGRNFALLFKIEEFYYEIFASFRLDILMPGLASSINP